MSYLKPIVIALGQSDVGLELTGQLVDEDGAEIGAPITDGFSETGNGTYLWSGPIDDDFVGAFLAKDGDDVRWTEVLDPRLWALTGALARADVSSPFGGTYDPATDSLEAIRDHGDADWANLAGSGTYAVEFELVDALTDPIIGEFVTIADPTGATTIAGPLPTNSQGKVTFNLNAGDYAYLVPASPYWDPEPMGTFTVSGPDTITIQLSPADPGAAYSSPDVEYVKLRTAVNTYLEGVSSGDMDTTLAALIPSAEAKVALRVTEAVFYSSTLTIRKAQALKDAVALRTGAAYLRRFHMKEASGSGQALVASAPQTGVVIYDLLKEARALEFLVIGGASRLKALAIPGA